MIEALIRVKVCGLTDPANALACAGAGADWIGLNFHPASPRSIPVDRAALVVSSLGNRAEAVGLFVDRPPAEIREVADRTGLRLIQLHGDESPEDLVELLGISEDLGLRVIRAFRLGDAASVDRMIAYLDRLEVLGVPPFAILVDAHVPGQPGGTGLPIPEAVLEQLPGHPRLILAGGLDPSNVAERVALVRPWMVDVASGVESSKGVKDPGLVSAFIAAARARAGRLPTPSTSIRDEASRRDESRFFS